MGSITNRLERLEAAREPPGRWRTPEQEARRERGFADLYRRLGVEPPPPSTLGRAAGELCALVAKWREANTTRKDTQ